MLPNDLQPGLQTCARLQIYRCSHYNALLAKPGSFEPAFDRRLKYRAIWRLKAKMNREPYACAVARPFSFRCFPFSPFS